MLLSRFEKFDLKDYMVYNVPDETLKFFLSEDNGFQQCYLNNDNYLVRLHFKVETHNKGLMEVLHNTLQFFNKKFNSNDDEWTVCFQEKNLGTVHKIILYIFSNNYCINFKRLKQLSANLHIENMYVDSSIYYNYSKKFKDLVVLFLPNQSDFSKKYSKKFKLIHGNFLNVFVNPSENLKVFNE